MDAVRCVVVSEGVIATTLRALQQFGTRRLEGLVLWLGDVEQDQARVTRAFVPEQHAISSETGYGYFVEGEALFELNRALARTGLRLIAQVHSHPMDAYHSDADDRYAIVTAEGGLSLVVPFFGQAPANPSRWAVYRLMNGEWQELSAGETRALFQMSEE